jgi:hypothetical protein
MANETLTGFLFPVIQFPLNKAQMHPIWCGGTHRNGKKLIIPGYQSLSFFTGMSKTKKVLAEKKIHYF